MTITADKYRKAVPPAFAQSKDKYIQDELTKIERVFDLAYDSVNFLASDGAKMQASIKDEATIRANQDGALAQKITDLSASVDTANKSTAAALTQESTARASRDDALSTQITNLTATVTTNQQTISATVSSETTARANADSALSTRIDNLNASVGSNAASISQESTARANADSSLSQQITTLSSTVGGNTASITQQAQVINGIQAKWGVQLNANGRVAGVTLNSGAQSTSFDVQADSFNIYTPAGVRGLYWDGANLVVRGNIQATSITTDAIQSQINNIPAQTISRPVVGNPTVVAQGNWPTNYGASVNNGWTEFIDTGFSVGDDWTTASTNQYLATATITDGTIYNNGINGWAEASVVVGDGLGGQSYPVQNRVYIKFTFSAAGSGGSFGARTISWKLARL